MIRAYTGPTELTQKQHLWVARHVASSPPADEIRTGAARGVDTLAALVSAVTLPDAEHVVYVPAAPCNDDVIETLVNITHHAVKIVSCPERAGMSATYRLRNKIMVEGADELVAFVHSREFYRSGEWMTINIARDYNVQVMLWELPQSGEEF
jgi:hypothetical protein